MDTHQGKHNRLWLIRRYRRGSNQSQGMRALALWFFGYDSSTLSKLNMTRFARQKCAGTWYGERVVNVWEEDRTKSCKQLQTVGLLSQTAYPTCANIETNKVVPKRTRWKKHATRRQQKMCLISEVRTLWGYDFSTLPCQHVRR